MANRIGTSTDMIYDGDNLIVKDTRLTFDSDKLLIKNDSVPPLIFAGSHLKVVDDIGATPVTQDSSSNAANTVTVTAVAGSKICVSHLVLSVSGAATTGAHTILIKDNNVTKFKYVIPAAAAIGTVLNIQFYKPLNITAGDLVVVCEALGAASISTINLGYFTVVV